MSSSTWTTCAFAAHEAEFVYTSIREDLAIEHIRWILALQYRPDVTIQVITVVGEGV